MTEIPDKAITAAAVMLHDEDCCDGDTSSCGRWNSKVPGGYDPRRHIGYYEDRARVALEAAAPIIAAEAIKTATREQYEDAIRTASQEFWDAEKPRLLAEVAAATDERLEQAVAHAIASHPFALVWRDERGTEICRSTPVMPGTAKIAIPLDAQSADLIREAP